MEEVKYIPGDLVMVKKAAFDNASRWYVLRGNV